MVIPEIELREVTVKVMRPNLMIRSVDPALQQAEVTLDGICGYVATSILPVLVVDRLVARELSADRSIRVVLVGHQARFGFDVVAKNLGEVFRRDSIRTKGANAAAALDESDNRSLRAVLRPRPPDLAPLPSTDVALVRFHDAGQFALQRRLSHRIADPVAHEPCALVRDPEHAMNLVCAHALFGSVHEVDRGEPLRQGDVAILENRPDGHAELLPARFALQQSLSAAFSGAWPSREAIDVRRATMGARRAFWPAQPFKVLAGRIVSVEPLQDGNEVQRVNRFLLHPGNV